MEDLQKIYVIPGYRYADLSYRFTFQGKSENDLSFTTQEDEFSILLKYENQIIKLGIPVNDGGRDIYWWTTPEEIREFLSSEERPNYNDTIAKNKVVRFLENEDNNSYKYIYDLSIWICLKGVLALICNNFINDGNRDKMDLIKNHLFGMYIMANRLTYDDVPN